MSFLLSQKTPVKVAQTVSTTRQQIRNYAIPNVARSVLSRRVQRKLTPGKTRPPIFYQFECLVELSDGSTYTRRSLYPRVEWKYLADQRNNPAYNPTRTNLKVVEADATGRLARFNEKFGLSESMGMSDESSGKKKSLMDEFMDAMGEGYVPVQSGGKLAGKRRSKK